MTFVLIVQLPVTGAFGTDADFDLRTLLERDLHATLVTARAGECGRSETEFGRTSIYLEGVLEPNSALEVVKLVLADHDLLNRATVVLETHSEDDPDDTDRRTLWPVQSATVRVA